VNVYATVVPAPSTRRVAAVVQCLGKLADVGGPGGEPLDKFTACDEQRAVAFASCIGALLTARGTGR
jgi:hypothetical protein